MVINLTGSLTASGGSLVNTTLIPSNLQLASRCTGNNSVAIAGNTGTCDHLCARDDRDGNRRLASIRCAARKTLTISGNSQIYALFGF